jgi:hypothetical protein
MHDLVHSLRLAAALPFGISCIMPGLISFIQFLCHLPLLRSSSAFPCALHTHSSNTLVAEMAHDDDHGKHPRKEDSSREPPPLLDVDHAGQSLGECG